MLKRFFFLQFHYLADLNLIPNPMRKTLCLVALTFLISNFLSAQNKLSIQGQRLYDAKNYALAGSYFARAAAEDEFAPTKQGDYYNAACSYALAGKTDSAMLLLRLAVKYGYDNAAHIREDSDLASLHGRADWPAFAAALHARVKSTGDPLKAQLITSDVRNFWRAYDLAKKDTAHRLDIYEKYYTDQGTPGLQEYFQFKVGSMQAFIKGHDQHPKFYASIRKNTMHVEAQKPQMLASFVKFKELYPEAQFPDLYFIIGAFSSGGGSGYNGLLIGLDMRVRTPDIPTGELSLWQRNNFTDLSALPHTVAHELIHFNQGGMAGDTTLLHAVLVEGMADFIGELISGKTSNERLHAWAKGREKQIWADFEKELYLNRARNWIANSDQETADKPADLGYWVGYQICKAYYDKSTDKKQAIAEMLHIKDYRYFYEQSGAGERLK